MIKAITFYGKRWGTRPDNLVLRSFASDAEYLVYKNKFDNNSKYWVQTVIVDCNEQLEPFMDNDGKFSV